MKAIHLTLARYTHSAGGVLKLLLVLALLAAPSLALAQGDPERPRPEDGYFQETVKIAPGVWLLAQPHFQVQPIGNVTIIEQSNGLVLVDAGGSPGSGRRIVAAVRSVSPKSVKAVIITHWHGDHPQGLSEILKEWPSARTIATGATQAHLRDRKTMNTPGVSDAAADEALYRQHQGFLAYARQMAEGAPHPREKAGWLAAARLFAQYAEDMRGAVTIATAEAFEDRLELSDANAPVELRFLGRANTDGDAVVWLPKQRILITGDIVVAPFPFGFGSYPTDWIATLARLRAYDFRVLVPGHGAPQHDRTYLDRVSGALADVRAQVAPLAAEGLNLDDVRKRLDLNGQVRSFAGDDPWLRRWVADYWVTPIVTSAYKEAKGQPIVQSLGE